MAITSLPWLYYPTYIDPQPAATIGGTSSVLLNASGDKCGFVIVVPKTGTLDKAEFLWFAVGNNPDNGMRVSFQDVDATTGNPDGVQDQYRDVTGSPIAAGWCVPGLMTSDGTDVGSKRSVTAGQKLAIVIEYVSFVASDSISVGICTSVSNFTGSLSNYVADASSGTYSKTTGSQPLVVLKYDDGTYATPIVGGAGPVSAFTSTSYNSGSTPDEYAVAYQLPFQHRVCGLWARADINDDTDLVLYSGTTALATVSLDKDQLLSQVPGIVMGIFSTSQTQSANTTYRIGIKPTTTTNIQIYRMSFNSTAIMDAVTPGSGWYESTRTDAGAWSDTTTNRPVAGLIIDGIDFGGSSGGGSFAFVG